MLHPEIELRERGAKGLGLVALALIVSGEIVWEQTEEQEYFSNQELEELPIEKARLAYWDNEAQAFAIGINDPSNYMNHSCQPNLGWKGEHTLVAIKNILPGEEVTYDYATSDYEGINGQSQMVCLCGSDQCRKVIKPDDLLTNPDLRERYKGLLPPSIEEWLKRII